MRTYTLKMSDLNLLRLTSNIQAANSNFKYLGMDIIPTMGISSDVMIIETGPIIYSVYIVHANTLSGPDWLTSVTQALLKALSDLDKEPAGPPMLVQAIRSWVDRIA